ncbi:MAG: hypothetical protein ABL973_08770 [Micropepsaceae bacterium]
MNEETQTGRSIFLRLVVFLMNTFMLVSATSASLGLIDNLYFKSAMNSEFYGIQGQVGLLAIVLTFVAVAALILVPQLSKIVLLPPVLVFLWLTVGAPGVSWSMTDHMSLAMLNAIALGAVAFGFVANRLSTGHWFMAAARLPFKENLLTRTLIAMPIAALVIVFLAVGAVIAAIPIFIEQQSRGYLHFASEGLEVRETVLVKGDHVVHLVGMVHIGDPAFYRTLFASIPPEALILAEGVTDKEGRMKARPSYDNAARGLGLESQSEFQVLLAGANRVEEPLAAPSPATAAQPVASSPNAPHVLFADIDVSDLSPSTLRFLEAVGTIFQSSSLSEAMQRYVEMSGKFTDDEVRGVMDEIVRKRNDKVIAAFDKYEPQYRIVYLPWGALHMPDLEDKLLARGYKVQTVKMLPIARYDTIVKALTTFSAGTTPAAPHP